MNVIVTYDGPNTSTSVGYRDAQFRVSSIGLLEILNSGNHVAAVWSINGWRHARFATEKEISTLEETGKPL